MSFLTMDQVSPRDGELAGCCSSCDSGGPCGGGAVSGLGEFESQMQETIVRLRAAQRARMALQEARAKLQRAMAMPTFAGLGSLGEPRSYALSNGKITFEDLGDGRTRYTFTGPGGAEKIGTVSTSAAAERERMLTTSYQRTASRLSSQAGEYERFRRLAEGGHLPPGVDNLRELRAHDQRQAALRQREQRTASQKEEAARRAREREERNARARAQARERRQAEEAKARAERQRVAANARNAAGGLGPPIRNYQAQPLTTTPRTYQGAFGPAITSYTSPPVQGATAGLYYGPSGKPSAAAVFSTPSTALRVGMRGLGACGPGGLSGLG